jgi:hypothetical protein
MGYDIRPIGEINTFDYSQCIGIQNAETVRRSLDGQLFIVEGENINIYTHAEILEITQGENWQIQETNII